MPEAVGFDLDYTLAVTTRDRATLLETATEVTGAPPLTRDAYVTAHDADLATETREPIFAELLADHEGADPQALTSAYRHAIEEALEPVDGARDLLEDLRASGYRLGLLTDGPVRAQRGKLDRLGWTDVFDAVVVTGALAAGKPDACAFEALLSELDVAPDELVYVGDHVDADVRGATQAGIRVIQVLYDGGPAPDPRASATVDREHLVTELPAILRGMD